MTKSAPYAVIGIGVILMAGIAWWFGFRTKEEPAPPVPPPAIELSEGLSIYTNGEHGFLLAYPEGALVEETFDAPRLPDAWSVNARPEVPGTPLLSVTTYSVQQELAYPRDYRVVLRVGKSDDEREVARCAEPRTEQGEKALADRVIGDTTFSSFSFGDAGMMQFVSGTSYRTVYEGSCWALEAIRTGSTYKEEPIVDDVSEETLAAEYSRLESIIDSFRFAR